MNAQFEQIKRNTYMENEKNQHINQYSLDLSNFQKNTEINTYSIV